MAGHRIRIQGVRITKDGKVVKAQPKLSRPAAYAKAKKERWGKAK